MLYIMGYNLWPYFFPIRKDQINTGRISSRRDPKMPPRGVKMMDGRTCGGPTKRACWPLRNIHIRAMVYGVWNKASPPRIEILSHSQLSITFKISDWIVVHWGCLIPVCWVGIDSWWLRTDLLGDLFKAQRRGSLGLLWYQRRNLFQECWCRIWRWQWIPKHVWLVLQSIICTVITVNIYLKMIFDKWLSRFIEHLFFQRGTTTGSFFLAKQACRCSSSNKIGQQRIGAWIRSTWTIFLSTWSVDGWTEKQTMMTRLRLH